MRRGRRGGLSFYQRKKKISNEHVAEIMSWIFVVLLGFLLAFFVVYTVGIKTTVMGSSMETGLHNGQVIYMNRIIYSFKAPSRGDVVVFKPNGNENAHYSIKRVIAVPGDKVCIADGVLYLNGEAQEDIFTDKIADPGIASDEITLKSDEFFVMGDNVNNSEDSRSPNLGLVMREHLVGQAWLHLAYGNEGVGKVK
ncbi:MAG: signal peptidase I [Lachnospiraceae bacterium]|nr:signal peptidase I [Lachnospiraceae bacterium]MDN4743169.1 signal peptidase I [Lachnospiraceae bacterium C1.1]